MKPVEKVVARLEGVRQRDGGFLALCPAHADQRASLSVSEGDDGRALLNCFAGCSLDEILDALGLAGADLFERNGYGDGRRKPSAIWRVKDAGGEVQAVHARFDRDGGKQCLWRLPGARKWGLRGRKLSTLPLYRCEHAESWPEDMPVVVAEGEKAADALAGVYPAVVGTVTGAEGTPGQEALEVLRGRRVILWPDNDRAGREHMVRIAEALVGMASEIRWFEWEEAPEKGDAADHPAVATGDPAVLKALAAELRAAPTFDLDYGTSGGSSPPSAYEGDSREGEAGERRRTQAELLIRCATGAELFHTPAGEAYATVPVGDHRETHPIRSNGFRRWLVRAYFSRYARPPGAQALQDAIGLLEARAQFDGLEREVHVRVAEHEGAIYVDLANDRWEIVRIRAGSWRVVSSEDAPVRFRRPRGMMALPTPTRGGTVKMLRRFVNVSDDDSWRLLVAWLVQALRPTGPYPVLLLQGEQGSAKSTLERLLRALVDPSAAALRTTPRNEHDFYIAATSSWVVALDNISILPPWLSDALCRLSTGGGFSTRTLYENREQELFEATRPLALNGITDVATRPDLLDRALVVSLSHIPEEKRKPESTHWAAFEKARPSILGALFDAVAGAMKRLPSTRLKRMPRMADFALWATAAEPTLGWKKGAFMEAYSGNRTEATESALDADPVAGAVRRLMKDRDEWTGTASELWAALDKLVGEPIKKTRAWPGAPNALSVRMKRLAPALRDTGIEYGEARGGSTGTRLKTLTNKPAEDRQDRQDRQHAEKTAKESPMVTDGPADGPGEADDEAVGDRQQENPVHKGDPYTPDDADGADDDSRADSSLSAFLADPPGWYATQAEECKRQGAPERLLKPLAVAVAYQVFGNANRWAEALPQVEAALGEEVTT